MPDRFRTVERCTRFAVRKWRRMKTRRNVVPCRLCWVRARARDNVYCNTQVYRNNIKCCVRKSYDENVWENAMRTSNKNENWVRDKSSGLVACRHFIRSDIHSYIYYKLPYTTNETTYKLKVVSHKCCIAVRNEMTRTECTHTHQCEMRYANTRMRSRDWKERKTEI